MGIVLDLKDPGWKMTPMQVIRILPRNEAFDFNFKRKAWHMLGLLVPAFFYFDPLVILGTPYIHITRMVGLGLNVFMLLALIVIDVLRFRVESLNQLFIRVAGPLLKEQEHGRMNATIPYLTATLLLFSSTQEIIAGCATTFLMLGDPVAAYIGGKFGRVRFWNSKSLEGMLAFFLAGTTAAGLFLLLHSWLILQGFPNAVREAEYSFFGNRHLALLAVLVVGSAAAAVTEFFSSNRLAGLLDDNLEVPIMAAIAMAVTANLCGFSGESIFFDLKQIFARG